MIYVLLSITTLYRWLPEKIMWIGQAMWLIGSPIRRQLETMLPFPSLIHIPIVVGRDFRSNTVYSSGERVDGRFIIWCWMWVAWSLTIPPVWSSAYVQRAFHAAGIDGAIPQQRWHMHFNSATLFRGSLHFLQQYRITFADMSAVVYSSQVSHVVDWNLFEVLHVIFSSKRYQKKLYLVRV